MQFMADVQLVCETCQGTRYKEETREILLREKSICDILQLDIASAYDFFNSETDILEKKIREKMKPLLDVGLGYLKVGQSSSTLSGGEAQRIKLASFLSKGAQSKPTLFIFDEPTTGLHFYDVEKLLCSFQALLDKGHSVVVIEHNLDVIKSADWIIDMGPGGGANGGRVMFSGIPEELIRQNGNLTGLYLKQKLMLDGSLQDP
jgi:excinuclease ABC subunit A